MQYCLLLTAICCGVLTSCKKGDAPGGEPDIEKKEAELMLTVNFDMGPSSKVGDPGVDHGENVANWDNIGIYLVYKDTRQVLNFKFSKEEFESPKIYNVYAGNVDVYVAAFAETEAPSCPTPESVYNMKSANVRSGILDVNAYMQNLFSGVTTDVALSATDRTTVSVVCRRLVAKVDMQYDVQPGLEEGNFVDAKMSAVSFSGVPQAYVFPGYVQETPSLPVTTEILNLSSNISERNGRIYSYMFPGESYLNFTVDYIATETKSQKYVARFNNTLNANTWYKVNFSVKGTSVGASETVEVGLAN